MTYAFPGLRRFPEPEDVKAKDRKRVLAALDELEELLADVPSACPTDSPCPIRAPHIR